MRRRGNLTVSSNLTSSANIVNVSMIEGSNIRNESVRPERTKGERLDNALKLIDSAAPVTNAEDAFNLVNNSFLQIEEQEKEPRMRVGSFQDMHAIKANGKNIYYTWYIGHILL